MPPHARTAWFRMNDPGATEPTGVSYRLKIDCPGKIIAPLAHRRQDAAGTISDYLEYGPEEAGPIEGGTVMEIAYLALCTYEFIQATSARVADIWAFVAATLRRPRASWGRPR